MKEDKNKNLIFWIIIIVLIIIILILLFFNKFGRIENKYLTPTGNVDVFNIDFGCGCDSNTKCDINDKENTKNSSKNNTKKTNSVYPVWSEDDEEEEIKDGIIYVDDKSGNYLYHQKLNIFDNPFYKIETKIAPGVFNSYSFVVHNNSTMNVKYYLEMDKKCDYDIDLKYRLKKNGEFVLGNDSKWVSDKELKTTFTNLDSKGNDKYILDWKWEYESGHDDKDTYIGENMSDAYKLNVKFYFEEI